MEKQILKEYIKQMRKDIQEIADIIALIEVMLEVEEKKEN